MFYPASAYLRLRHAGEAKQSKRERDQLYHRVLIDETKGRICAKLAVSTADLVEHRHRDCRENVISSFRFTEGRTIKRFIYA